MTREAQRLLASVRMSESEVGSEGKVDNHSVHGALDHSRRHSFLNDVMVSLCRDISGCFHPSIVLYHRP